MSNFERLVWVTHQLRLHCPWTARLTHQDLTEYLIEEAYEALEAIEGEASAEEFAKELGDVLFQVVLHSEIAQDFGMYEVAAAITAKMIRRNPHVFTPEGELLPANQLGTSTIDDVEKAWEHIKQAEKRAEGHAQTPADGHARTPADGHTRTRAEGDTRTPVEADAEFNETQLKSIFNLPAGLPALAAAAKVVDRAGRQEQNPLPQPSAYSTAHVALTGEEAQVAITREAALVDLTSVQALGKSLFELVQHARERGLDPERALRAQLSAMRQDLGQ